jgi:spore germination protein GerM
MQTSDTAVRSADGAAGDGIASGGRPSSRRARTVFVVVLLVVVGFVARSLVTEGSDSVLVRWLPWMQKTPVTLFFGDATSDRLVPVSRGLGRVGATPEGLLDALLAGPTEGIGLRSLVPAGTSVAGVDLTGSTLTVDLAGDVMELSAPLTRRAVFASLASWPGVDQVIVTVDGTAIAPPTEPLLYFYDEPRDMLVAEPTIAADPRELATAFLAGPGDPALTGLPTDVTLNSFGVNQDNGLLTLEMSYVPSLRQFALDHPDAVRRVLVGFITTMTTAFPQVDAVYLDFEGHATLGLGQCADLLRSAQLTPETINDERVLARYGT